ncbi:hypothetical protein M0813_19133 [Anaeramoeba flamelloides]|uniref:Uncharacterized protein n=1 Tax=Anaeramoeba flamelloides TaxID=1746091 RepID=A0ABQ8YPC4_9EUKA|nr:hypothetical protein M0813_19133 [Anaeramoeba flamelloides]
MTDQLNENQIIEDLIKKANSYLPELEKVDQELEKEIVKKEMSLINEQLASDKQMEDLLNAEISNKAIKKKFMFQTIIFFLFVIIALFSLILLIKTKLNVI